MNLIKSAKVGSYLNIGTLLAQNEERQLFGTNSTQHSTRKLKSGFVTALEQPAALSKKFSDKSQSVSKWFGGHEENSIGFDNLWIASGSSVYYSGMELLLKNCTPTALICLGVHQAAIGTSDGQILVMDRERYERTSFEYPVTALSASSSLLYVGYADGTVKVMADQLVVQQELKFDGPVNCLSVSPSDGMLIVCILDQVLVYALQDLEVPLIECSSDYGSVLCVAWTQDSEMFAFGGQDDCIYVYDNMEFHSKCVGHLNFVNRIIFDKQPYGYKLLSVGDDCNLFVWDIQPNDIIDSYGDLTNVSEVIHKDLHAMPITDVLLKNNTLVTVDRSGYICQWSV